MKTIIPESNNNILCNPGCGILYLQRGRNKVRYDDINPDSWFLRERLTDKIAFSIPWSVIEPEEGNYRWEHSDWEGCINSWVNHGFKVALTVRGMDTTGTFYDDGVPQWVFDSGAKYVDEPIEDYRDTFLLNSIPADIDFPVRYPVYWDPVYLDKVEQLVAAMGRRYNGRSGIEYVAIGHMGRWGEMHIANHGPLKPWIDAGFNRKNYISAHKRIIDTYLLAFPDTQLSQEICYPCFGINPETPPGFCSLQDVDDIIRYLVQNKIHIKFNGFGKAWGEDKSLYIDDSIKAIMEKHYKRTKTSFENLILPNAMTEALSLHVSYWHRGGESQGLGIAKVNLNIPIQSKKIYSFYSFFADEYDKLTIEDEKKLWRETARKCGYRLELRKIAFPESVSPGGIFDIELQWKNTGSSPCYEKFMLKTALYNLEGNKLLWEEVREPSMPCSPENWDSGKTVTNRQCSNLPRNLPLGKYELLIGLQTEKFNRRMLQLPLNSEIFEGLYRVAEIVVA